jgi:hypothetical protein
MPACLQSRHDPALRKDFGARHLYAGTVEAEVDIRPVSNNLLRAMTLPFRNLDTFIFIGSARGADADASFNAAPSV